jgi:uncharacterized protein YyaL (SSP411 family)
MKTLDVTIEDRIKLIADWLLNSGIQAKNGGFYSWRDAADDSHAYLYSEITGYAITALCFLHKLTGDTVFLSRARSAAQWIEQDALDPSGGVLTRNYVRDAIEHYSFERGNIYSFDCAMVAFGMLKLYQSVSNERYLDIAEGIISFLNKQMLKPEGTYYPVFDTKIGRPWEDQKKWSTQSGSFHCKLALCLCELSRIKKDNVYKAAAKRLISSSIEDFYKGGRFVTSLYDGTSHLHPYSYTLEGMLYYAHATLDDSFKGTAAAAYGWASGFQDKNGGLPTRVSSDGRPQATSNRSDIQAQMLRLSYYLSSSVDRERLLERLLQMQDTVSECKGAFLFGADADGSVKNHQNSWCSMFALQALCLAAGRAGKDLVLEYLI